VILAIDVGQTGSRYAIDVDGDLRFGMAAPLVAGQELVPSLVEIVQEIVDHHGGVDVIAIGTTGLHGRPPPAAELHGHLVPLVGHTRTVLADDAVTSYLGALGDGSGAVVAAGTGVVALASDGRSRAARVDGVGYLLGDAGSGYWIGRAALDDALRARDGRGGSDALRAAAERSFGDLGSLPARLAKQGDRVTLVASFARAVAEVANEGDRRAAAIWEAAADELAASAAAALQRCHLDREAVDVVLTGALRHAGALLMAPFGEALTRRCPRAMLAEPIGDALAGAVLLASVSLTAFSAYAASASGS
jgi:glucosamine kinase